MTYPFYADTTCQISAFYLKRFSRNGGGGPIHINSQEGLLQCSYDVIMSGVVSLYALMDAVVEILKIYLAPILNIMLRPHCK